MTLRIVRVPAAVTPALALALFRIAQEALNNIGKHSKATTVAVDLSLKEREMMLSVSDNGIGFIPGGDTLLAVRGIGLASMRERAESVGGRLKFNSVPGVGTTLCVQVPLSGQNRRETGFHRGKIGAPKGIPAPSLAPARSPQPAAFADIVRLRG
jgi:signal transduction histidine kinase